MSWQEEGEFFLATPKCDKNGVYSEHRVYKKENIFFIEGFNGCGEYFVRKYDLKNGKLVELPDEDTGFYCGKHFVPTGKSFKKFRMKIYAGNRNWQDALQAILNKDNNGFASVEHSRSFDVLKITRRKENLYILKYIKSIPKPSEF